MYNWLGETPEEFEQRMAEARAAGHPTPNPTFLDSSHLDGVLDIVAGYGGAAGLRPV